MSKVERTRIFATCFAAIVATSFCFVLRALVIDDWGVQFGLTETQKGELLGVGLWPFSITIVLLSLAIDRIGFRVALFAAFFCHAVGLSIILLAQGYWGLYAGTFFMALGNGAVEAASNPLIATIFPEDRPTWLNRLHAAWPLGMILGGVLAMILGPVVDWRVKVALMAVPVIVYAALSLRQTFPPSERAASGVSYREMLANAGYLSALIILSLIMLEVGRVAQLPGYAVLGIIASLTALYAFFARAAGPLLYLVLVLLMIPLATTELSTDGWITSLVTPEMQSWGLQAGWVLVYTAAVVFLIRLVAGAVVQRFNPLGTLAIASALAALGLFVMSGSSGVTLIAAATLYGIGKSFFWGTSLALGSDQFPRGGAVTINVMAGAGMLAAGVVGSVLLGTLQDGATARYLVAKDLASGSSYSVTYLVERRSGTFGSYRALDRAKLAAAPLKARKVIDAAEADGRKEALRGVALLPVFTLLVYLLLIAYFRRKGGYRRVELPAGGPGPSR